MNEQQAGLTLAEGVTRFHRAMSPLMRWDGWPVLDVRHLAYRRRPGKTLLAETDDVLGPLNEPANDYEDLRAGETLLSESFLSRVPEFDDEVADARLETAHDMLRQAIAATVAVRPLVCADRRDYLVNRIRSPASSTRRSSMRGCRISTRPTPVSISRRFLWPLRTTRRWPSSSTSCL